MNPLIYYFLKRYDGTQLFDERFLTKYQKEKEICEKYHTTNYSPKVIIKDGNPQLEHYPYASMNIKITRIEKRGVWTTETITEEKHGFHLDYFNHYLAMTFEDYMDLISATVYGHINFRFTFTNPLFIPMVLKIDQHITYIIEVINMFYVEPKLIKLLSLTLSNEHFSTNILRETEETPKTIHELMAEYNPMQWYNSM